MYKYKPLNWAFFNKMQEYKMEFISILINRGENMDTLGRMESGFRLLRSGRVKEVGVVKLFEVKAETTDDVEFWTVKKYSDGNYSCNCPDFEHRTDRCKHIWAVALKEEGNL